MVSNPRYASINCQKTSWRNVLGVVFVAHPCPNETEKAVALLANCPVDLKVLPAHQGVVVRSVHLLW